MRITITKENNVLPFGMYLDVSSSTIPTGAPVERHTTSLPGVDGELHLRSRYSAVTWNLTLVSPLGADQDYQLALWERVRDFWAKAIDGVEVFVERQNRIYYAMADGELNHNSNYNRTVIDIPLVSDDPFRYELKTSTISVDNTTGKEPIKECRVRGNIYSYPVFKISGSGSGSDHYITIGNANDGATKQYILALDKALGASESVTVDSKNAMVIRQSANGSIEDITGLWSEKDSGLPLFPVLLPGVNDVFISNGSKVSVSWKNRWV